MNFRNNTSSRFWKNRFLGFDPNAPCGKKFAFITLIDGVEKGYQRSCILLTVTPLHSRVRIRRESNNGIHALWLGQASWVTRKVVCMHVVAVLRIVHELWVVSHESFTCFTTSAFTLHLLHRTLYRRTHILPFFALQMSIPPQLSPPQYISNLNSSRQKTIWNIWTIGIQ